MTNFWTAERRAWIYRIAVALVPLLTALGLLAPELGDKVLAVVAAILSTGSSLLALANVTPDEVNK